MQADPKKEGTKKEWLYIAASMHHFLGGDERAMQDLKLAETLTYKNPAHKDEQNANINKYLNGLIGQYKTGIQEKKIKEIVRE